MELSNKQLFEEVFDRLATSCHNRLTMSGMIVYWDGEEIFNTDGYSLAYNLHRLTNLLDRKGIFL